VKIRLLQNLIGSFLFQDIFLSVISLQFIYNFSNNSADRPTNQSKTEKNT